MRPYDAPSNGGDLTIWSQLRKGIPEAERLNNRRKPREVGGRAREQRDKQHG